VRVVRLLIAFQGTRYEGWQSQKNGKTLQEIFEKYLAKILKAKTDLISSSRTDSGVHARGMVAHFKTRAKLPDNKIQDALNYYLPQDAVVLSAKTVPPSFHARYAAKYKVYEYVIWNSRTRPAYDLAPFCLWQTTGLNVSKMRKAAKELLGKHDFSAFRDSGDKEKNPVRNIHSILIRKNGPKIAIRVRGNGFLRHMVRIIAGTLIEVGRGKLPPTRVKHILESQDRTQSGPTSQPHALTLLKVAYP
jgi:tRNA pseudouridine38-40 synthase